MPRNSRISFYRPCLTLDIDQYGKPSIFVYASSLLRGVPLQSCKSAVAPPVLGESAIQQDDRQLRHNFLVAVREY